MERKSNDIFNLVGGTLKLIFKVATLCRTKFRVDRHCKFKSGQTSFEQPAVKGREHSGVLLKSRRKDGGLSGHLETHTL